ncbi:MAG: hypothetical protein AAB425_05895 [Bdellovibrionota bacterium]
MIIRSGKNEFLTGLETELENDAERLMDSRAGFGGTVDIYIKQTPPTSDLAVGTVEMFQCSSDVQGDYAKIDAATTAASTVQYTVAMSTKSSNSGEWGGYVDYTFTGDTDGAGALKSAGAKTITVNSSKTGVASHSVKFTSDGTINKLAGTDGTNHIRCAWNATLGCAQLSSGAQIPFALSVSSTGQKTYSTSTDSSVCASLPDAITTLTAPASAFSGTTVYDCGTPSGCETITVATKSGLEDQGGTQCASLSNHWKTASQDLTACTDSTTASGIGCYCSAIYAAASNIGSSKKRSLLCAVMGLANNGTLDLGSRTASTQKCAQNVPISAR